MENGTKKWQVTYDHKDGRSGVVNAETTVMDSGAFQYGNGKAGELTINDAYTEYYDLRYTHGDLHRAMIEGYFGKGFVKAVEI